MTMLNGREITARNDVLLGADYGLKGEADGRKAGRIMLVFCGSRFLGSGCRRRPVVGGQVLGV